MFKSLVIEPTNMCNLRCSVCIGRIAKRKQGMMSFDLYKKIIDEAAKLKINRVALHYGGEPTIHPLFAKMIMYAIEKGLYINFNTNGVLLTEYIIDTVISGHITLINFSIHTDVDLDTIENNIAKIRNKRVSIPQIVVMINIGEFDDGAILKLKKRFNPLADKIRIHANISYQPDMKWSKIPLGTKVRSTTYCREPQKYIAVLWDGRVTICCRDIGGEMAFGNINSNSLVDTWNSEYYVNLRKCILKNKFLKGSLCERCHIRGKTPSCNI